MHPDLAVPVALREHPIADRNGRVVIGERACQARQGACAVLVFAIVQSHRVAVHFGDAHQLRLVVFRERHRRRLVCQRGREPDRAQAFEIDFDHGCV